MRKIREPALEALREMRLLIYEIRPRTVSDVGLVAAIESRLATVEERAGIDTTFSAAGVDSLPRDLEEALHGIAREALNNVLRHAGASAISVGLRRDEGGVVLEIADDGVGFDPAETGLRGGMGLAGMEDRAAGVGGRLTIRSGPAGTVVLARVPLS
jgi:signal transduction histidine kinase